MIEDKEDTLDALIRNAKDQQRESQVLPTSVRSAASLNDWCSSLVFCRHRQRLRGAHWVRNQRRWMILCAIFSSEWEWRKPCSNFKSNGTIYPRLVGLRPVKPDTYPTWSSTMKNWWKSRNYSSQKWIGIANQPSRSKPFNPDRDEQPTALLSLEKHGKNSSKWKKNATIIDNTTIASHKRRIILWPLSNGRGKRASPSISLLSIFVIQTDWNRIYQLLNRSWMNWKRSTMERCERKWSTN